MKFEYLYSGYSKNYTFMKMPKILFSRDEFKGMSSDAKILYMFMLELAKYSELSDWTDEMGRLFVIVKIRELMKKLNWSKYRVLKTINELDEETGIGLIYREKHEEFEGNVYFVKDFRNGKNGGSKPLKNRTPEV